MWVVLAVFVWEVVVVVVLVIMMDAAGNGQWKGAFILFGMRCQVETRPPFSVLVVGKEG